MLAGTAQAQAGSRQSKQVQGQSSGQGDGKPQVLLTAVLNSRYLYTVACNVCTVGYISTVDSAIYTTTTYIHTCIHTHIQTTTDSYMGSSGMIAPVRFKAAALMW